MGKKRDKRRKQKRLAKEKKEKKVQQNGNKKGRQKKEKPSSSSFSIPIAAALFCSHIDETNKRHSTVWGEIEQNTEDTGKVYSEQEVHVTVFTNKQTKKEKGKRSRNNWHTQD